MKFRTGLVLGLGVGYVLGAKAGRQRYEQLKSGFDKVMENPQVQQIAEKGKDIAESSTEQARKTIANGFNEASSQLRDRLES
ncbi:MAG: YtxH domain-containing protein [Acidimicrobiia bacterium]|nr:YtxH domain-containing protein [Acidimicrobiia bacterium]